MTMPASDKPPEDTNIVETLQSLIVAFALAMAVRSFVTEGFFIPTGSMAPTLMGSHVRIDSGFTGYEYPVDSQVYEMVRAQMGPNWQQALTAAKQVREAEKQLLATGGEAMRAMTRRTAARCCRGRPRACAQVSLFVSRAEAVGCGRLQEPNESNGR